MKTILIAAGLGVFLVAPARSQGTGPSFSGTWSLDVAKSDFGPAPAPTSLVHVIEHTEPNIKMVSTQKTPQGEVTNERHLTTDGKENVNKVRTPVGDQDVKSTMTWKEKKLVMVYQLRVQAMVIDSSDSWGLSEDGKVLTILRDITSPQGGFTQKVVFNKQ